MYFAIWALIVGALLITMGLSGTSLRRLPVSTAMLYLAAGFGLGPAGLALMAPNPLTCSGILERAAEVAVLISLFAVSLKLGLPLSDKGWRLPVRLAIVSMTITVALIAVLGMVGLGLSLGAAVLLGAILAPTDPVLASDADRRGRDRSGGRCDALVHLPSRRRRLVRSTVVPRRAPRVGVARIARRARFARSADHDFLVRHPRHRLDLLPDVCDVLTLGRCWR